jgi:putative ABC transport system ATP-binding protein
VLQLRDVHKHYASASGDVVRAVDGVSLSIGRGELVALYGPSGSGKTTLLKIVAALLRPDSGSVVVDGTEITQLSKGEASDFRLSKVGLIPQTPTFVRGASAIDNAALKLLGSMSRRRARAAVEPIMVRLGLGDRLANRPEHLSGGEQQRVLIARALSIGPAILLADEPTGNLDSRRSRDVLDLLREVSHQQDVATLLVTHDAQAASYADRALELHDGQLRAYVADIAGT